MIDWSSLGPPRAVENQPAAVGGSMDAGSLLEAYRHGYFPLPTGDPNVAMTNEVLYSPGVNAGTIGMLSNSVPSDGIVSDGGDIGPYATTWWHPPRRPLVRPGEGHLSNNTGRFLRRRCDWTTTANTAFSDVLTACQQDRHIVWLTRELRAALEDLHRDGWAHSFEVWDGEALIGGVFGIGFGATFSMDSMFHRASNAGTVAFANAYDRLSERAPVVIDLQWPQPFVEKLGATWLDREEYLALLDPAAPPIAIDTGRRDARVLGERT